MGDYIVGFHDQALKLISQHTTRDLIELLDPDGTPWDPASAGDDDEECDNVEERIRIELMIRKKS